MMADWGKKLLEFLAENLCPQCGGHYNDHRFMALEKIEEIEREGGVVKICDMHITANNGVLSWEVGIPLNRGHFVRVIRAPDNPCDVDYMKEISDTSDPCESCGNPEWQHIWVSEDEVTMWQPEEGFKKNSCARRPSPDSTEGNPELVFKIWRP